MRYIFVIFLTFNCLASTRIEVRRKSDGKLVAGDAGPNVTIQSLQKKTKFNIDPILHEITIVDEDKEKADRELLFDSLDENHPKYKQYLKEIVKEWLKKKRMELGD